MLVKLAASSGNLPSSLFLRGLNIGPSRDPLFAGGFSDIFKGTYQGQKVAVKRPRVTDTVSNPYAVSASSFDVVTCADSVAPAPVS
jgi:hypothetical protein